VAAEGAVRETERRPRSGPPRADHCRAQIELRLHNELDRAFSDLRAELNAAMRPEISTLRPGSCPISPTRATTKSISTPITASSCSTKASPSR